MLFYNGCFDYIINSSTVHINRSSNLAVYLFIYLFFVWYKSLACRFTIISLVVFVADMQLLKTPYENEV